ncbi:SusC/RagA family TonB-linked outer membrane protein [Bacteroidia bacterium]|nr:SusC/RagA family TonB-linked outer membrane protein [Bacteroidia bacterium]
MKLVEIKSSSPLELRKLARKMKLTLFFSVMITCCWAATEPSYAQKTEMNLTQGTKTLKELFTEVESKSEYIFFYNDNAVDLSKRVEVDGRKHTLPVILDKALKGSAVSYEIVDRQIIIYKEKDELSAVLPIVMQGHAISGVVRDALGPIVGANIIVKGTTNGSITDVDGRFTLTNIPDNAVLQVSFIGYLSQEVRVGNQTNLTITIEEDTEVLDEVVVVGYGTMQKKDLTGSVSQVQSSSLQNLATARVDQALTGKLAGVQVLTPSGEPGAATTIRIRGVGSISAGTDPLYVIDGFPSDNIQMLNPNDIETIDILKDASATAIYGSRGANGVVIISTKRGKEGKAKINLDVYYGWQKVLKTPKFLTKEEQAIYYYDGVKNQNLDAGLSIDGDPAKDWYNKVPQTIMNVLDGSNPYNTDAHKAIFQTAPQQSYNLSAQGGSNKIKYAVSGEYLSQEGIIKNNDFRRFSVRANLDAELSERVSIKFNINSAYSTGKNLVVAGGNGEAEGVIIAASTWQTWYPLLTETGDYFSGYGQDATNAVWNPLAQINEIKRKTDQYRTLANLNTNIKITSDLNLNIMLGANTATRHGYAFLPKLNVFNNAADGNDERSNMLNWITETTLNYQKNFNLHHITGLVGYTTQQQNDDSNMVRSRSYPNNLVHTLNAVSNILYQGNSNESQWSLLSYLARVGYNYNSRYYVTASIRSDGSSRFGRDRKYGYFPSAALAWRISEEGFLKDISQISDLKMRASYGVTGNNNIGNYAHLATVGYESYVFGNAAVGGIAPSNIENSLLTWEKQNSINFGLDIALFNSRINLIADYFITKNHDLLLNVYVPQITGFNTSLQNIGEVENKGWEFTVNTQNFTGEFEWSTNFNISAFKNKVLKLGPEGAPIISTNHITQIGQPMGMFYGYITDGVFMNQAELDAGPIWAPGTSDKSHVGDVRFKDVSGPNGVPDGVINTYDMTIIGNPYPDVYFGMTNNFAYKNFAFSFSLTSSYGNKVFNIADNQLYTRARYKQYADVINYWKSEAEPGDGISPRPNNLPTGGVRQKSSRYLDDGSYLKINNINLSYNIPKKLFSKLGISDLRLYVTSTNPFIFTKYRDFNPEVSSSTNPLTPGQMNYNYPIAKSLIFGINISF